MALTTAVLNAAGDGAAAILGWGALHTADTSGSQVSNERVALAWDAAAGAIVASGGVPLSFTGTANAPATRFGVWSAQSGGTFRGSSALTGDQTFSAAGTYVVTAVTLTVTDSTT